MDRTSDGVAGRMTIIGSVAALCAIILGGVFNLSNEVNGVNARLDRNREQIERTCLAVKQMNADLRFHVIEEAATGNGSTVPDLQISPDC